MPLQPYGYPMNSNDQKRRSPSVGTREDAFQATAWGGLGPWWASLVTPDLPGFMAPTPLLICRDRGDDVAGRGPCACPSSHPDSSGFCSTCVTQANRNC